MTCIDTHILIWGLQQRARPGQEQMVAKATAFFHSLAETGESVMLPAPAAQEYLSGFDTDAARQEQMAILQKYFMVPALDLRAAELAASIISESRKRLKEFGVGRQEIRIDAQIIAIAIANGATRIVSHDSHMKTLAGSRIVVTDIPDVQTQRRLEFPG